MYPPLKKLSALIIASACAATVSLAAVDVYAAPKDAKAQALFDGAMDEDYLNTEFDAALAKLKKAIKTCGSDGCSAKVLGKIYVGMGLIYDAGKDDKKRAKEAYEKAVKAYPKVEPMSDYMTDAQKKLFADVKAQASSGGDDDDDDGGKQPGDDDDDDDGGKAPAGDLEWSPPSEALVNTPLPVFIKVDEDFGAARVKVRFKSFGGTKWQSVKLRKLKGGFGGMVPCSELTTTGKLRMFVIVVDDEGDPISTAGTRSSPLIVQIRNEIDGDQPNLPGEDPPDKCMESTDCPPDFPGCGGGAGGSGAGRGEKGWGATCDGSAECREGLMCLNGSCEKDDGSDPDPGGGATGALNFVSLGLQFDLMAINSATDVCGSVDPDDATDFADGPGEYLCYVDGEGEFLGKPTEKGFNEIQGGLGFAGVRILAGYDRLVWEGLMVGGRLGVVIGGTPSDGNADSRFDDCVDNNGGNEDLCNDADAPKFDAVAVPLHAEVRASWMFLREGLVRPYAFLGGGYGAASAGVALAVCDTVDDDGVLITSGGGGSCPDNTDRRNDIVAYQVSGTGFVDIGGGAIFVFHPNFGAYAELKLQVLLPTVGVTISPSIGPVAMF